MNTPSKNPEVNAFLTDLQKLDSDKCELMQKLREVVQDVHPNIDERVIYGGIMFSLGEDCGGIFASSEHVSFEFSNGYKMDDPKHLLEGEGEYRRHLKIRTVQDITDKDVTFFVGQFSG